MELHKGDWRNSPYDSFDSMEGIAAIETSAPPRFFHSLPQSRLIHAIYPGVLVAGTIALASTWLALQYTAPVMLFALLFGMAFHFLHEEGRCVAGIEFSSRTVLRTGVALLGVKITLTQIASLGLSARRDGHHWRRLDDFARPGVRAPSWLAAGFRRALGRRGRHLRRFGGARHRLGPAAS